MRVLIAGGGVAAIECLLALRELAGPRIDITLLTPEREFIYRPVTVAEAFERGEARAYAVGTTMSPSPAPATEYPSTRWSSLWERSLARLPGALTFRGRRDVPALRRLLDELVAGAARSVPLTLPSQRMWSLSLYELALMTASHLRASMAPASGRCGSSHPRRSRSSCSVQPQPGPSNRC